MPDSTPRKPDEQLDVSIKKGNDEVVLPKVSSDSAALTSAVDCTLDADAFERQFEQTLQQLPNDDSRIAACLGITEDLQPMQLPGAYRTLRIKVFREDLERTKNLLKGNALRLSEHFAGNPDDGHVTLTCVVPYRANIAHLTELFRQNGVTVQLDAANTQSFVLTTSTSGAFLVGSNIELDAAVEPPASPQPFDAFYATPQSLKYAQQVDISLPRPGFCTYLIIDQGNYMNLIEEISVLARSPDFYVTFYNGNIVILGLAEACASFLEDWANGIRNCANRAGASTKMLLGKGVIEHVDNGGFAVKEFSPDALQDQQMQNSRAYITAALAALVMDPTSRHARGGMPILKAVENSQLCELVDFVPKVKLHIGGPDKLVGYDEESRQFRSALIDNQTRLMIVKGLAGIGKSRVLDATLNGLPSSVRCSLDASGQKIPGSSLLNIIEQLSTQLMENERVSTMRGTQALYAFSKKTLSEKLNEIYRNPDRFVDMCVGAARLLNTGKTPFLIDDMHYIDGFSDPYIEAICSRYMAEGNGKVILSLRPEEYWQSQAVRNLRAACVAVEGDSPRSVKELELTGLDFSDENVAHEYVFYSLPPEIRQGKVLGPWFSELGQIAGRSPFVMTALMNVILEQDEDCLFVNLVVDEDTQTIMLADGVLEELGPLLRRESDLQTYYLNRIEKLEERPRQLLQCIALMGGGVATDAQIIAIARKLMLIRDNREFNAVVSPLVRKKYLVEVTGPKDEQRCFRLQYDTIKDYVIDSIRDPNEKLRLSYNLHACFKEDPAVPPEVKFVLAHNVAVAPNVPEFSHGFWKEYMSGARQCIAGVINQRERGKAYEIASTIISADALRTVSTELQLHRKERLEDIDRFVIEALFNVAQNAFWLGRYDKVHQMVAILETIHSQNPEAVSSLVEAHVLEFDAVYSAFYTKADAERLQQIYDRKLQGGAALDFALRALIQMKLAYRRNDFAGVEQSFSGEGRAALQALNKRSISETDQPSPSWLEALRLSSCTCPFGKMRNSIRQREDGAHFDDDVLLQPSAIDNEQRKQLLNLQQNAEVLLEKRFLLAPSSESSLLWQQAQILAFFGKYDEASDLLLEAYRKALQAEGYREAAAHAKVNGDVLVNKALGLSQPCEGDKSYSKRPIRREVLLNAIKTYTEQGMVALSKIDKANPYQLIMRVQRIRAIGILCISYKERIKSATLRERNIELAKIREEIEPNIKRAFDDFLYINKQWPHTASDPDSAGTLYDLVGYMGYILSAANELSVKFPQDLSDKQTYPFMTELSAQRAEDHSKKMVDAGCGEIDAKTAGLKHFKVFV